MKAWMRRLLPVIFCLSIWQLVSMTGRLRLFLASPAMTAAAFLSLLPTGAFQMAVLGSCGRILLGFLWGFGSGALLAVLAHRSSLAALLLGPFMRFIRAVPVVSFIILALLLLPSGSLPVFIAALMCLPVTYLQILEGLRGRDPALLEMARVFHVSPGRRIRYLDLMEMEPQIRTAASLSMSLAWKSGTAAEVIGMTGRSIGGWLQEAKIYLNTAELFAMTFVVVILSAAADYLLRQLLDLLFHALRHMKSAAGRKGNNRMDGKHEEEELLRAEDVAKAYGDRSVLEGLDLTLRKGEVYALTAPSGAGKTTLLNILAGLERPDAGLLERPSAWRISMQFQEDRLLMDQDIRGNLLFVNPHLTEEEIEGALRGVGLQGEGRTPARELSGGMCRRTAFLRALLAKGELLLLDEPFTGLDGEAVSQAAAIFREYVGDRCVVMAVHHMEEADGCGATLLPLNCYAAEKSRP